MPEPDPTPVVPQRTASGGVHVTLVRDRTSLRLKSWLPEHMHGGRPAMLTGQEFPSKVGATLCGPMRVLCVGPGDWLVVSQPESALNLREFLEPEALRLGLALVDVTDGLAILDVRGSTARELLSKGCGIDWHPRMFPVGRCTATRFAQIPVVIDYVDASPRFELHVARSYFEYLYSWLLDAAAEFGGAAQDGLANFPLR